MTNDVAAEPELRFGTDGWRDVIADRFTFDNVSRAAQGYADHLDAVGASRVVVGYDTRFLGARFARRAAEVLAANGLEVLLSSEYLPTPALSFAVRNLRADGGVMITASHNPPMWSGFKLKGGYGGSASDSTYSGVAERVRHVGLGQVARFDRQVHAVHEVSVRRDYYDALTKVVNLDTLAQAGTRVVHDAMGGAGAGWLTGFFEHVGLPGVVVEVRERPDPTFYGVNPEPIAPNLGPTMQLMRSNSGAVMFAAATDGDGDRLGVVLPGGAYFNSHQIFAVLLDHLVSKGGSGAVVKTFTVGRIVERLARARGLSVLETKVGFKYITDAMLAGGVLLGGEESGGIGVTAHLPERDGLANTLLLMEAVVQSGEGLAERFGRLEHETGWRHAYDRLDLHLSSAEQMALAVQAFTAIAGRRDAELAGRAVSSVEDLDGVKLNLADDAWLLVRPSGTEPVLRIYCEGPDEAAVAATLAAAGTLATAT